MKFKLKDQVIVTSGKDKGKQSEIQKVLPASDKVVVKGVNLYKRHLKSREGIEGGIISLERPLSTAKIAVICPTCKLPTRVGYQVIVGGKKQRICRKCQAPLDKTSTPTTSKSKSKK